MNSRARLCTLILCGALLAAAVWIRPQGTVGAAEGNEVAWGANHPAWGPDGERLAFTLFGSIWTVAAEGGDAQQLTNADGVYDAHPAWSPDGQTIAFIRGGSVRGPFPQIRGELVLVDVETGRERAIEGPQPTAGTPAWSPDSSKIAIPLGDNSGALLYVADAASGELTRRQSRLQSNTPTMAYRRSMRRIGRWMEPTWSADGSEIYYAGERQGAAQIWSLPGEPQGFQVQKPWTRYAPDDITQLGGVAAMPDGSLIYSADEINARGNYELYRIASDGTEPEAITNSARHELTPAVTPDGKKLAWASNQLGNIDLFTRTLPDGEAKHLTIEGLRFRDPSGQVRLRVLDEMGQPTRARIYVTASDDKAYAPRGMPIWYYPVGPGEPADGFFLSTGDDTFPAPAGRLEFRAIKGFEYRISDQRIDVAADGTTQATIQLERWTNWNQLGWYSGENHFHANYLGSYYERPPDSLEWLEAMDLNAANMITANAAGAFIHDKEFFTGKLNSASTDRYKLYWGQEYRNSDPLGHMGFLNISSYVPPSYTSVPGSDSPYDFPLNTMAAMEAKKQGGFVTYMHPIGGEITDVFDTNLGAKEAVITAAHGALDTLDLLPYGEPAYQLWYGLLNCGFRIAAGAGTDAFTNWRGINRLPGSSRVYVHTGTEFSWDRWIEGYREANTFATTGPLLTFSVNGAPLGADLQLSGNAAPTVKLVAETMSRTPLERLEFIHNGRIIHSEPIGPGASTHRAELSVKVEAPSWFAVRVSGPGAAGLAGPAMAHTSPIWVQGEVLVREDLETAVRWIDRFWANLVERDNFGPAPNQALAHEMVQQAREHYLRKLRRSQSAD